MTGNEKPYLSIIVPMFNEEENVIPVLEETMHALVKYPKKWEIIIIDDGSNDATYSRVVNYAKNNSSLHIKALVFQRNFGQTAALQAGIDYAQGEVIATMDGDLQNPPDNIPKMIEILEQEQLDLLCGWRKKRQDNLLRRRIPSWFANKIISSITRLYLRDNGCSLKVYRASIVKNIRLYGEMHRFIPIWISLITDKSKIKECAVSHRSRQFGTSKYGLSRVFKVICDMFFLFFIVRYLQKPGRFFGLLALLFLFTSMGVFVLFYFSSKEYILYTIFCIGIFVLLLAMGITSEILIRILYSNRRSYHIKSFFQIENHENATS